jgi:hypothetical protein
MASIFSVRETRPMPQRPSSPTGVDKLAKRAGETNVSEAADDECAPTPNSLHSASILALTMSLAVLAEYERAADCVEALGALNRWPGRTGIPIGDYLR